MTADTELPAHGSITSCPKCGGGKDKGTALTVTYHTGPQEARSRQPCRYKDIGEHLCRRCERCGYGWCESVVSEGAAP